MSLNEFIEKFADQFEDTEAEEINAETYFQELDEWDSLTTMSVIAFVKTQLGKTITGKEIRSAETVDDLYNLVISK